MEQLSFTNNPSGSKFKIADLNKVEVMLTKHWNCWIFICNSYYIDTMLPVICYGSSFYNKKIKE